jgi:hypothetical protein
MTTMTDAPTSEQIAKGMALITAGVSVREAAKHLIIGSRILQGLDLQVDWLEATYQLLADLAHELDPAITPYPEMD